jgi:bifunctional oligoribonuclease and PAP phosphatase NrnA
MSLNGNQPMDSMRPAGISKEDFAQYVEEIGRRIVGGKRFWIFCHESPDGDTIGCSLAMYGALKGLNKDVHVYTPDIIPRMYQFLPFADRIEPITALPDENPDAVIFTDNASFERVGKTLATILVERGLGPGQSPRPGGCVTINIDHHVSNELYSDINLIDAGSSACGELFLDLFKVLKLPVTMDMAINIYATILTDTGRFSYGNTNFRTFQVASELIQLGVNPFEVVDRVYNTRSEGQIKLLAMILDTITPVVELGYFYCMVTQEMLKRTGTELSDTDGAVDIMKTVGDYSACFLLKEEPDGAVKVSARSNQRFNVNQFARRFGGGGHPAASGFRMCGPMTSAPRRIHEEMERLMAELGQSDLKGRPAVRR